MKQPAIELGIFAGLMWLALLPGCKATRSCPCPSPSPEVAVTTVLSPDHPIAPPEPVDAAAVSPLAAKPGPDVANAEPTSPAHTPEPTPAALHTTTGYSREGLVPSSHDRVFLEVREELERLRCGSELAEPLVPGHAADYTWLIGRLQYVEVRNAWRLRYAAPSEEDRYGGTVTLEGGAVSSGFQNGLLVRVEGRLKDPASREPSPAYHVRTIQFLSER